MCTWDKKEAWAIPFHESIRHLGRRHIYVSDGFFESKKKRKTVEAWKWSDICETDNQNKILRWMMFYVLNRWEHFILPLFKRVKNRRWNGVWIFHSQLTSRKNFLFQCFVSFHRARTQKFRGRKQSRKSLQFNLKKKFRTVIH